VPISGLYTFIPSLAAAGAQVLLESQVATRRNSLVAPSWVVVPIDTHVDGTATAAAAIPPLSIGETLIFVSSV
jgi:hypothetical protein